MGFQQYAVVKIIALGVTSYKTFSLKDAANATSNINIPFDAIGYYTGYIIGLIVQEILIFIATAGAGTLAEVLRGVLRSYVELGKMIATATGRLTKALHQTLTITVETFMQISRQLMAFAKQVPKHLETLKVWVDELLESLRVFFDDVFKTTSRIDFQKHFDDFRMLRPKFQDKKLVEKLWNEKIDSKLLFNSNLKKLYFKYLDQYPNLRNGFNQAEFKTTIKKKGKLIEEVEEFSVSGKKSILLDEFGNPPKLPPNTINVLDDWENFEKFVGGAVDFVGQQRKYDSEIKYIFNFLKNHMNKGDEFVIETKNIFKTCGSCRREFVMLEDYLKTQGKKVKIVVFSDESIEGTRMLKDKLKIK